MHRKPVMACKRLKTRVEAHFPANSKHKSNWEFIEKKLENWCSETQVSNFYQARIFWRKKNTSVSSCGQRVETCSCAAGWKVLSVGKCKFMTIFRSVFVKHFENPRIMLLPLLIYVHLSHIIADIYTGVQGCSDQNAEKVKRFSKPQLISVFFLSIYPSIDR